MGRGRSLALEILVSSSSFSLLLFCVFGLPFLCTRNKNNNEIEERGEGGEGGGEREVFPFGRSTTGVTKRKKMSADDAGDPGASPRFVLPGGFKIFHAREQILARHSS